MKENDIHSKVSKKFKATIDFQHNLPVVSNILNCDLRRKMKKNGQLNYVYSDGMGLVVSHMSNEYVWSENCRRIHEANGDQTLEAYYQAHDNRTKAPHSIFVINSLRRIFNR